MKGGGEGSFVSDGLHDSNVHILKKDSGVGGLNVYAEAAQTVTQELSMWVSGEYWGGGESYNHYTTIVNSSRKTTALMYSESKCNTYVIVMTLTSHAFHR